MSRITFKTRIKRLGWEEIDNPEGPLTLAKIAGPQGALQVSTMLYRAGEKPQAGPCDLIGLAMSSASNFGFEVIDTRSGACPFGSYGVALCRNDEFACVQVWYLSNGDDFILATYIAADVDEVEVRDAETLILDLSIRKRRRWWKVW